MFLTIHRFALGASLFFCAWTISAAAQTATAGSAGLSLREAISMTLAQNPQLNSFQFRQQAAEGEWQAAAVRPALQLSAELENIAGSGGYKGADVAELTLALSSVIELGDKREARLGVASERQRQLAVQQKILELDLLAEVTRRFIAVAAAQQQLRLQQSTQALSAQTLTAIQRRAEVGNMPDAELARARANQVRAHISQRQAELQLASAKIKLAALWAATEPSFNHVSADLFAAGDMLSLNDLLKGLANNPDLLLFASEARLRDAELQLALSQRRGDLEWSAGVRRLQETKDSALVVGLSMPLGSGSRAVGEIAVAKANRLSVDSERDLLQLKMRAQIHELYQQREAEIFAVESLRSQVIPQLKKALADTRLAFDRGRYSYLELSAAQHELLQAEADLIDAAANAHLLRVEIERLGGAATTPSFEPVLEVQP